MNRRYFFRTLASGLAIAAAPDLFLPKLIKPVWKPAPFRFAVPVLLSGPFDTKVEFGQLSFNSRNEYHAFLQSTRDGISIKSLGAALTRSTWHPRWYSDPARLQVLEIGPVIGRLRS